MPTAIVEMTNHLFTELSKIFHACKYVFDLIMVHFICEIPCESGFIIPFARLITQSINSRVISDVV